MSPPLPDTGAAYATDWNAYDVPAIWAMVGDYDLAPQWTHVAGWRKASELTARYLHGMLEYRERLVAAWPPERNEAARAYLAELDKLLASARATQEAALANHDTAAAATTALSSAKAQLSPIYERWRANATTMASYEARVQEAHSGRPAPMPGPSPLPASWRDELNEQARAVMVGVSSELALASYRMVTPPAYTPPQPGADPGRPYPGAVPQSPVVPGMVPPVVPRPVIASPQDGPMRFRPPRLTEPGIGPALSGSRATGSTPTPLAPLAGPHLRSDTPVLSPPVGGIIGILPAPSPSGSSPARSAVPEVLAAPGKPGAPLTARPASVVETPLQRVLPAGAVIGAPVGTALVQPAPAARQVQRGNAVGGTIGAQPGPRVGAPSFRTADGHLVTISGSPGASSGLTGPGRTGASGGEPGRRVPLWDPDDPWATAEGVQPVLLPSPQPGDHDPGPAIGRTR